jgi:hypothetical protein
MYHMQTGDDITVEPVHSKVQHDMVAGFAKYSAEMHSD